MPNTVNPGVMYLAPPQSANQVNAPNSEDKHLKLQYFGGSADAMQWWQRLEARLAMLGSAVGFAVLARDITSLEELREGS
ncbi:hypothetical protein Pelo_19875 [Pelomyxa schiedti]|nr:hypothetical protein Pelo_19875 [Pelomyxa schiedti]